MKGGNTTCGDIGSCRPHFLEWTHSWTLRQPQPPIPIPLAGTDPDVTLDLEAVFTATYDRAGYDYSLRYDLAPDPPLAEQDANWAADQLKGRREP